MTELKMLTKEEILGADDLVSEVVPVPEWGGAVKVKTMTSGERDAYEMMNMKFKPTGELKEMNRDNMRARLCAFTIVDGQGQCLFSGAEVEALAKKSSGAMERVFDVAARLNGMGQEQEKIAETFFEGQQDDSPSDSPSP